MKYESKYKKDGVLPIYGIRERRASERQVNAWLLLERLDFVFCISAVLQLFYISALGLLLELKFSRSITSRANKVHGG